MKITTIKLKDIIYSIADEYARQNLNNKVDNSSFGSFISTNSINLDNKVDKIDLNNFYTKYQMNSLLGNIIELPSLLELRMQLGDGSINENNIGDTFTIRHNTYGDIQMQMVAYDDAQLADGESAAHTMTLLSKNCICKKQFDSQQKEYAITEDTVYRKDAIIMFKTSSTYSASNTNNFLIDDISKTGIQRTWTSFNGQYVIKYNQINNHWEMNERIGNNLYEMNYYLDDTDITNGNWYDNSNNLTSYRVTYIKKYYSYDGNNYTQKIVTLGDTVSSNTYEQNISCYANVRSRIAYGYNRYSQSGIRQWLNGSGNNWYTPLNLFCNPPSYSDETGFMDGFSNDFKDSLVKVKVKTTLDYNGSQGYNGYKYDLTEDKIFLPSYTEMFNLNNYNNQPQGNYWSYFDLYSKRIKKYNNSNTAWWLRSVNPIYLHTVKYVSSGGNNVYDFNAYNSNNAGVAFACVIKSI